MEFRSQWTFNNRKKHEWRADNHLCKNKKLGTMKTSYSKKISFARIKLFLVRKAQGERWVFNYPFLHVEFWVYNCILERKKLKHCYSPSQILEPQFYARTHKKASVIVFNQQSILKFNGTTKNVGINIFESSKELKIQSIYVTWLTSSVDFIFVLVGEKKGNQYSQVFVPFLPYLH